MSTDERIRKAVYDKWFLSEPALFSVLCSHDVSPVPNLPTPIRAGQGRIEYNPSVLDSFSNTLLEESFRFEAIRILLKHPYSRQPDAPAFMRATASDLVLSSEYSPRELSLERPEDYDLPKGESFEHYVAALRDITPSVDLDGMSPDVPTPLPAAGGNSGSDSSKSGNDDQDSDDKSSTYDGNDSHNSAGNKKSTNDPSDDADGDADNSRTGDAKPDGSSDTDGSDSDKKDSDSMGKPLTGQDVKSSSTPYSSPQDSPYPSDSPFQREKANSKAALWEENEFLAQKINDIIRDVKSWGSIPGRLVEHIIASTAARIDYRKALAGFRASIICSRRRLTRMRPNRRTGFTNMGSLYQLQSRLLVAVDVSASVTSRSIADFYSIINRFFRYGIERIDTMTFDSDLGPVVPLRKAKAEMTVCGRGGTNFQIVFDFFESHPEYDGLIIMTDGYASTPHSDHVRRSSVLWVLISERNYKECHEDLEPTGRVTFIDSLSSRRR
ncbi:MAG: hypothetical protein II951_08835 [Bacteroidales bacterium]|nr:hypothetical protein [Bacteroidales bacterium]